MCIAKEKIFQFTDMWPKKHVAECKQNQNTRQQNWIYFSDVQHLVELHKEQMSDFPKKGKVDTGHFLNNFTKVTYAENQAMKIYLLCTWGSSLSLQLFCSKYLAKLNTIIAKP